MLGAALGVTLALSACTSPLRPSLVEEAAPTPQPSLELDISEAPAGTKPYAPAGAELPLESSVDDALLAWAIDRAVPYLDACSRVTPAAGELCDAPTERDTVRLLGPSADETWYIVTIDEIQTADFGTGFRVERVEIAGG